MRPHGRGSANGKGSPIRCSTRSSSTSRCGAGRTGATVLRRDLREAAARDLDAIYGRLEDQLAHGHQYLCGPFSLADIALFPNLYATRALKLGADPGRFPATVAWLKRLAALPLFAADLDRLRAWLKTLAGNTGFERDRIFWRGDRIEWLLANGFHRWFLEEIEQGRVLWPGAPAR